VIKANFFMNKSPCILAYPAKSPLEASRETLGHKDALQISAYQGIRRQTHLKQAEFTMILYPAIDLKDGNCVRLYKGEMAQATVFNDNPAAQAQAFADAGCEWLHLVDLNGAFAGEPVNAAPVEAILKSVNVPAQLGGGIRDLATIEGWLEKGLTRVILGTVAVEDPDLVREAAKKFPGHVAVGIDARNGMVATRGWAEETDVNVTDLAKQFEDAGVAAIIYTDINRDGAMQGPNVEATAALAHAISIPVIASGGVSSMDDLRALKNCGAPLDGAISGRALYDGMINVPEAAALLKG
jgi:phosphoribosylformimino-5-aminoimidazole carboxamide ribotide isomerase